MRQGVWLIATEPGRNNSHDRIQQEVCERENLYLIGLEIERHAKSKQLIQKQHDEYKRGGGKGEVPPHQLVTKKVVGFQSGGAELAVKGPDCDDCEYRCESAVKFGGG